MENPYSTLEACATQFDYLPANVSFAGQIFSDAKLPDGYVLHRLPGGSLCTQWVVVRGGEQVAIAEASHAVEFATSLATATAAAIDTLRTKAWAHANDQAHAIGATTP